MSNGPNSPSPQDLQRMKDLEEAAEQASEKMRETANVSRQLAGSVSSTTAQMKYLTQALQAEGEMLEKQIGFWQKTVAVLQQQGGPVFEMATKKLNALTEAAGRHTERMQQMATAASAAEKAMSTFTLGLNKSADQSENMFVQLASLQMQMAKTGTTAGDMARKFISSGKAAEVVGNTVQELAMVIFARAWKQTLELNSAQMQFARTMAATGEQARAYSQQMESIATRNYRAGVTAKDIGTAYRELSITMTDFTRMSGTVQEELAETTALMMRFGASASDVVASLQAMNKYMGASGGMAEQMTRQLYSLAQQLRVPPEIVIRDYAAMANDLAIHGSRMNDVFARLYNTSRQTGLAMQEIVGITSQFDTFEGAANAAGRLNAVLGGDMVNSFQMMRMTDPTERLVALRRAIERSGASWQSMAYYEKQAIASAMGLRDVSQLARMMSGDMERAARSTEQNAAEQERLRREAETLQSFQEKLNTTMAKFAETMMPVLGVLNGMLNVINKIPGGGMTLITVLGGMAIGFKALSAVMFIAQARAALVSAGFTVLTTKALILRAALGGVVTVLLGIGAAYLVGQHSPSLYESLPVLGRRMEGVGQSARSAAEPMRTMAGATNQASYGMARLGDTTARAMSSMKTGTLTNMASGIRDLGSSLDSIHRERVVDFRTTAQVYQGVIPRAVSSAQQLKRDDVQKVSDLVSSANQLSVASRQTQQENLSQLVGSMARLTNTMNTQASSGGGYQGPTQISVDMSLDGRTLDKRIISLANRAANNQ
jgi:hypothetical protein